MEKELFKENIQDVDYTPILNGIDMMDPPYSIGQLKAEVSKYGENLKCKKKVQ